MHRGPSTTVALRPSLRMTGVVVSVGGLRLGVPGGGFGDEAGEEGARGGVGFEAALGVPLHAEDERAAWCVGACPSTASTDAVFGAAGGDAEAVAGDADGLVMAGIDGMRGSRFEVRGSRFRGEDLAEERVRCNGSPWATATAGPAEWFTGIGVEVLHQRAAAPHVQHLDAEADGEDRLAHVVRVLQQQLVDVLAGEVGGIALRLGLLAILLRIHIGGTAGQTGRPGNWRSAWRSRRACPSSGISTGSPPLRSTAAA